MATRNKVKLEPFPKESERKVSFRKRKVGLIKKLSELSTLCNVDASVITVNPFDSSIDVWPSVSEVERILTRFRQMPETEQTKYMSNQESFTRERIRKATEKLRKLRMENKRIEIEQIINQCMSGGIFDFQNNLDLVNDIDLVLCQKFQEINIRIKALKEENSSQGINLGGQP